MKKCPFCGEDIQDGAIKCRHCKEFLDKSTPVQEGQVGKKEFSSEEQERARAELAQPDPRPCPFDKTFESWLMRIGTWGKLKFTHVDPIFESKEEINQEEFIRLITDNEQLEAFGPWHIDLVDVNKVRQWRELINMSGETVAEECWVEIDLKPELKKRLGR